MKQTLFLAVAVICLAACKKSSTDNNTYTITGIVADWDSHTLLPGAKVYTGYGVGIYADSAIADASGRVNFTYKKEGPYYLLKAAKPGYVVPPVNVFGITGYSNRTDSVFLARPSFVNLTTHKAISYQPLDTIALQVKGDYNGDNYSSDFRTLWRANVNAPDKAFNLQTIYGRNSSGFVIAFQKMYFKWDIIRGGTVISTQTDSTDLVQFGIKNFNINY